MSETVTTPQRWQFHMTQHKKVKSLLFYLLVTRWLWRSPETDCFQICKHVRWSDLIDRCRHAKIHFYELKSKATGILSPAAGSDQRSRCFSYKGNSMQFFSMYLQTQWISWVFQSFLFISNLLIGLLWELKDIRNNLCEVGKKIIFATSNWLDDVLLF